MNYSFSAISSYKNCPKSFEFKYIKRMPEAFQTIERYMGSCIHETLRWLYEKRRDDIRPGLDQVKEQYGKMWHNEELKKTRIIKSDISQDDYFKDGVELVSAFFQNAFQKDKSKTLYLEQKFEVLLDENIKYVGIIDRVAQQPEGVIRIIDFKTGKVSHPLDDLQLPSYALYIFSDARDEKIELCFEDLRSQQTVVAGFDRTEVDRVRSDLLQEINTLQKAAHFNPHPSVLCQWCGFNGICKNPHESVKSVRSDNELEVRGSSGESSEEDQNYCPECGEILKKRKGKFGLFWGCVNYPDCKYTLDIKRFASTEGSLPDEKEICPECGGFLRERKGKFGPFMGCSNFPECRFTRKIEQKG